MIQPRQALLALLLGLSQPIQADLSAEDRETADRLLTIPDRDAFLKACGEATANGLPSQTLLEIRFLHLVEHGDRAQLAKLSEDIAAHPAPFNIDDSLVFAVPEDFQSILEYTRALVALEADDDLAFKTHITEAFWLSPKQSQLFGQHIEQRRLNKYLKELEVDLTRGLADQLDPAASVAPAALLKGSPAIQRERLGLTQAPPAALLKGSPAILLSFWSPWSNSVEEDLPALRANAHKLKGLGLPMVSVLLDGNEQHRLEADTFVTTKAFDLPSRWLVDHKKDSLTNLLRISEVPAFILLTPSGKVLYHGKPDDPRFTATLATLSDPTEAPATSPIPDPAIAGPIGN